MSTQPFRYQIPQLFQRISSHQNSIVKHFIALREKKHYRQEKQAVIIQGVKTISELRNQGFKIKSLAITTTKKPIVLETDIKNPASTIIKHPELFPAEQYYVTDIDMARRILGTSSRPSIHDIFAEIPIPANRSLDLKQVDKLLVFDQINDPGNLGTLIRSGCALGWSQGLVTAGTCDLYNDKVIRASRALSLSWQHQVKCLKETLGYLKSNEFTPIVADMLPSSSTTLWSPEHGTVDTKEVKPGTGIWFWNKPMKELPKKMALILSSEHNGTNALLKDEIRISIPMSCQVESLNVANAGCIIMDNLNRFSYLKVE